MELRFGLLMTKTINIDGVEYIKLEEAQELAKDIACSAVCDVVIKAMDKGFEKAKKE